jgi:hypothetical protein
MSFPFVITSQGDRWAMLRLFAALLIQMILVTPSAVGRSRLPTKPGDPFAPEPEPIPYLNIIDAPPLRFQGLPPVAALSALKFPAAAVASAAVATELMPKALAVIVGPPSAPPLTSVVLPAVPMAAAPSIKILSDDTPATSRVEDLLPFFRPPTPGSLPPSAATYQQK